METYLLGVAMKKLVSFPPGGEVPPKVGYTGRLRPKGVEEMVAKGKYVKGCHILAEMTT